jgi:soluble lytic murein transglycosylase-like protein
VVMMRKQVVAAALLAAALTIAKAPVAQAVPVIDCKNVGRPAVSVVDVSRPRVEQQRRGFRALVSRMPGPVEVGDVQALIYRAAGIVGISPQLLEAVARAESNYRHDTVSRAGAIGIMQLTPSTAAALGVDPCDPWQNVLGGARYLKDLLRRYGGRLDLALAAYNAGPGAIKRHGGIPPYPETRRYVYRILEALGGR